MRHSIVYNFKLKGVPENVYSWTAMTIVFIITNTHDIHFIGASEMVYTY